VAVVTEQPEVGVAEPGPPPPHRPPPHPTAGSVLRFTLAAASLGAAVLHFGYSPSFFDRSWAYGAFFVAVAWLQVAVAVGLVSRPSRAVLSGAIALDAAVVLVWVASRTAGVAIGPDATSTRAVGYPDVLATALELLVVAGCVVLLAAPAVLDRRARAGWLAPAVVAVSVIAVAGSAAYALTPSFTDDVNPGNGSASARPASGPDSAARAASGSSSSSGSPSGNAASGTNPFLTGTSPCEKSGPPVSEAQIRDSEGHFHRGPNPQQPIDEQTRTALELQQAAARSVVAKYPTVADAERAGYRKSTAYVPCIGAHYTNPALTRSFDPAAPSELLYDGTNPDSRIVGLSYLVFHDITPPEGFAGPNDLWHRHSFNGGLCLGNGGVVIGAESTSEEDCTARGGHKAALFNMWMVHDWVVPGFECSWGVFAAECPELGGRTGGTAWDQ
jgi:hypothetical protein